MEKSYVNVTILIIIEPPLWPDTRDTKTRSHRGDCGLGGMDRQVDRCQKGPHVP